VSLPSSIAMLWYSSTVQSGSTGITQRA